MQGMRFKISGLYAIVDSGVSAGQDLVRLARDYLEGGLKILQLRDKTGAADRLSVAKRIAAFKAEFDFLFIVNDDLEVAKAVNADGIHVGKDDPSPEECRRVLGPGKIVGYSSHALEEAVAAESRGADYVAFGAIYPTATKGPGHPVQGLEKLRRVVASVRIPVVAIGGIGRANIKDVLATGVHSVAMISALAESEDRAEEVRHFCRFFS